MKIVMEEKLMKTYKVTCNIPVEIEVTLVDENHGLHGRYKRND